MLNKQSPASFITEFLHPSGYQLHDWQRRFINEILVPQYHIHGLVKGRQIGFTSLMLDLMIHSSLTRSNHNSMMVVRHLNSCHSLTHEMLNRISHLETKTGMTLVSHQDKRSVTLVNGSAIRFITCNLNATCSESAKLLIFDGAAFMRNFNEVWLAMFPTVGPEGRIIIGSTPNGKNDFYHHIERLRSSNVFLVHEVPSSEVHPQSWIDESSKYITPKQAAAEYGCKFV